MSMERQRYVSCDEHFAISHQTVTKQHAFTPTDTLGTAHGIQCFALMHRVIRHMHVQPGAVKSILWRMHTRFERHKRTQFLLAIETGTRTVVNVQFLDQTFRGTPSSSVKARKNVFLAFRSDVSRDSLIVSESQKECLSGFH